MQEDQKPGQQSDQPSWQFAPEDGDAPAQAAGESVKWSASEFLSHQKSASWYLLLALAGFLLAIIVYVLTRDFISTGVVAFAAVIMGVLGAKQPRILDYSLNNHGLTVGTKFYDYRLFKAFSVIDDGGIKSIILLPLKRFMPLLSVYFDPKDEDKVVGILSTHLAFDQREYDMVDKFMRKLRF